MEFVFQLVVSIISAASVGAGIYAGIKQDLGKLHERATTAKETADSAHRRIDDFYMKGK
jgi:hypothetical protein